jgi:2-methylcitrate dehydratase PrpD
MDHQPVIPNSTVLDVLGRHLAGISYEDIDSRGLILIKVALVDTLGVAIAGAEFEGVRIARGAAVETKPYGSLIIGTQDRASALDAGLLNGIAAHALDYDDGNGVMGGHPSTLLVPAILALGEERGSSARDAIVGYAAGYEAIVRLARGLNPTHYKKGWHPTSTIGLFGVAAAAARMLELDAERTTMALAIAASMACGVKANFGSMTKALHVGHAVRDGLLSAKLAAGGYSANRVALDGEQGFLNVYNGEGYYDAKLIVDRLEAGLEVNRNVNSIKAFPCCASSHSAIKAALDIRHTHGVRTDDIEGIQIVVDRNRMPHTDRPHLDEALSGKFSLQYVVARALKDGGVGLEHFEGNAHRDPTIVDLMRRVQVSAAPAGGVQNSFAADVFVTARTSETFHGHADRVRETSGEEPTGLWDKFRNCAGQVLTPSGVEAIVAALNSFPEFGDVRSLMLLTAVGPERRPMNVDA